MPDVAPYPEIPAVFACEGETLCGVLHLGAPEATRGVLIVVGGPQYRVGSHRQFLLLARQLAANGIPVLRFDYRGMGDSEGALRDFDHIGPDIRAALDWFTNRVEGLNEIVIWGLCDAASAAAFYAHTDPRVAGLVLLNPWVRTQAGEAKAYMKHYYVRRLIAPEFWGKVFALRWNVRATMASLAGFLRALRSQGNLRDDVKSDHHLPLPERMRNALSKFPRPTLVILSGQDLTAAEFRDAVQSSGAWRDWTAQPHVKIREFPEADHTFSSRPWRDRVADWTLSWVRSW